MGTGTGRAVVLAGSEFEIETMEISAELRLPAALAAAGWALVEEQGWRRFEEPILQRRVVRLGECSTAAPLLSAKPNALETSGVHVPDLASYDWILLNSSAGKDSVGGHAKIRIGGHRAPGRRT